MVTNGLLGGLATYYLATEYVSFQELDGKVEARWRRHYSRIFKREVSNLLFYVDRQLQQGRVMKVAHTPADTAAFTKKPHSQVAVAQLRRPIDIALIGTTAYITDAHHERPALYAVDVKHVCRNFNTAQRVVDEAAGDDAGGGSAGVASAVTMSATAGRVVKVTLGGELLRMPYGIASGAAGSQELYVSDHQTHFVYRLTLSNPTQGCTAKLLDNPLPAPPAGVHLVATACVLLIAAGDSIYSIGVDQGGHGSWRCVLRWDGAVFCGLSLALPAYGGTLFAVDHKGNAVVSLACNHSCGNGALQFAPHSAAVIVAGGNVERPCSRVASVWYEGTATKVTLWAPSFGIWVRGSFIFMNGGGGPWGKVLLLNDLYPMVDELLPATRIAADAFALTHNVEHHAASRLHAGLMLTHVANVLEGMVEENAEANPRSRGLEGPLGNFSRVVRRSSRQLADTLLLQVDDARRLGAPQRCLDAMTAAATMTLCVEIFFAGQRTQYANPHSLQYACNWAEAQLIEMARMGQIDFSYRTRNIRLGRSHYHLGGAQSGRLIFQLRKPAPRAIGKCKRAKRLVVLRGLASLFKQVRQGQVTDKSKERMGAQPASTYAPPAVQTSATEGHPDLEGGYAVCSTAISCSQSSLATGAGQSEASGVEEEVLFRAGDIVSVLSVTNEMWVAQLKQPIIATTQQVPSAVRLVNFASSRVSCRYFVPTRELFAEGLEHAAAWWMSRGAGLQLADEEAAFARAAESDGVHFSYEKADAVTCSTVHDRLLSADQVLHRSELISFSIAEATVEAARERISLLIAASEAAEVREAESEHARAVAVAASEKEAAAAKAAASASRYAEMQARRETGKRLEAAKKGRK